MVQLRAHLEAFLDLWDAFRELRPPPPLGRGDGVSEDRSVFVGFDSLFVHGVLPLSHTHMGTSSDDSRHLHLPEVSPSKSL